MIPSFRTICLIVVVSAVLAPILVYLACKHQSQPTTLVDMPDGYRTHSAGIPAEMGKPSTPDASPEEVADADSSPDGLAEFSFDLPEGEDAETEPSASTETVTVIRRIGNFQVLIPEKQDPPETGEEQ